MTISLPFQSLYTQLIKPYFKVKIRKRTQRTTNQQAPIIPLITSNLIRNKQTNTNQTIKLKLLKFKRTNQQNNNNYVNNPKISIRPYTTA
jgi:hypothetical protein